MIIRELQPLGFGRFSGERFSLSEGLHIFYGENEAGKTTLQWFIVGMLYGFFQPSSKRRVYEPEHGRYRPWNPSAPYEGIMLCEKDNVLYRIERVFQKDFDSVVVYNHATGENITNQFPYNPVTRLYEPGEALTGVSKTIFCNTLRVAQGQYLFQPQFYSAVQERMAAIVQTGDGSYSLQQAVAALEKEQEKWGTPKKSKTPYGAAVLQVQKLESQLLAAQKREEEYFDLLEQQKQQEARAQQAKEVISHCREQQERCRQGKEKQQAMRAQQLYQQCCELSQQITNLAEIESLDNTRLELMLQSQGSQAQSVALQEGVSRQIEELWQQYRSLGLAVEEQEPLEQLELYAEKYRQAAQRQGEINRCKKRQSNLQAGLSQMKRLNTQNLQDSIDQYRDLERQQKVGVLPSILDAFGVVSVIVGVWLARSGAQPWWYSLCAMGTAFFIVGACLFLRKKKRIPQLLLQQQEILQKYHAEETGEQGLTDLLGKVELNNYKIQQFQQELEDIQKQIEQGKRDVYTRLQEIWQYVYQLTGERDADPGEVVSPAFIKRVEGGRQILRQIAAMGQQCYQLERAELKDAEANLTQLLQQCGVSTVSELKEKQGYLQKLKGQLQTSHHVLQEVLGGKTLEQLQKETEAYSIWEGQLSEEELQDTIHRAEEEYQEALASAAQKKGQRQAMEQAQCPVGETQVQLAECRAECAACQQEVEAIELAKEKLLAAGAKIQREFAPLLSRNASKGLSVLTNGKYDKMLLTPELELRLLDKKSGRLVEATQLSYGAMELLYLTVRLYLGRALAGDNAPPLLLDDALAQIDQPRMEALLRWLVDQAKCGQILLFTCDTREADFLKAQELPFHFTELRNE